MKNLICLAGLATTVTPTIAQAVKQAANLPNQRPNIVIIMADDWGFPHAGAYSDPVVKTPTFDYVASKGVLFTNAYCAAPSSSPSRAAVLTGNHPHALREAGNLWAQFPADLNVYPSVLQDNGYEIGLERKGWAPGNFLMSGWKHNPAGPQHGDLAKYMDSVPAEKPICFWVGSSYPHRAYKQGIGEENGIDPNKVVVPGNMPNSPEVRGDIADYYYNVQVFDKRCREIIDALERNGRLENTLLVVTSDNGWAFPRAKANLYDGGSHVPMAIMWPGVIKESAVNSSFVNLTDLTATFYEAVNITPPSEIHSRSLMPILKGEEADSSRTEVFLERERHANVREGNIGYPSRAVRTQDFLYIRNLRADRWPVGDPPSLALNRAPYGDCDHGPSKSFIIENRDKYPEFFSRAFMKRPAEELYDLRVDPLQINNIAKESTYGGELARLRGLVDSWMERTSDPRVDPEYNLFDTYNYAP